MTRTLAIVLLVVSGCGGGAAYRTGTVHGSGDYAPPAARASASVSYESGGAVQSEAPAPSSVAPGMDHRGSVTSEPPPEHRAGLATQWGETRYSHVSRTTFVRHDPSRPLALASVHYNDATGSAIQAARSSGRPPVEYLTLADPHGAHRVHVSLRDEYGRSLPAYLVGDRAYVVGEAGRRYSVVVENRTPHRLEAVVSVDGLDVIRGTEAALSNRGYVVQPWGTLTIDGFRQSHDTVAAFRFGSVASSYAAQTTGSARNVGVVGVALFGEAGAMLPHSLVAEAEIRERANPFPGQFASPPPVHYVR